MQLVKRNRGVWSAVPAVALAVVLLLPCWSVAADLRTAGELESLKARLDAMEKRVAEADLKQETESQRVKLGGAIRFNYGFDDFSDSDKSKKGDIGFDLFRLNLTGAYQDLIYSAEYRWTGFGDYVQHAFIGYNVSDELGLQLGVMRVPFGNLPYGTHNFWEGVPFYIGFDDDFDMGVKVINRSGPWDLQVAFFKNAEWGNPANPTRYSYDVIAAAGQANEETNQFNGRLAYSFDHGELGNTEVGVSGEWGELYNSETDDSGDRWAAAAHLNGKYGPFNLLLQVAEYEFNPENPIGVDDRTVIMGAFGDAFEVASKGTVYSAGLSLDVPVSWGPIGNLRFYDDYSILVKSESGFEDSEINTLGCLVSAGPIFAFVDVISGRNALYLGGPRNSFGAGDPSAGWGTKLNINIGYYF